MESLFKLKLQVKLQTFIFIYIIVIGRDGQSLKIVVHYLQLLATHHSGLGI